MATALLVSCETRKGPLPTQLLPVAEEPCPPADSLVSAPVKPSLPDKDEKGRYQLDAGAVFLKVVVDSTRPSSQLDSATTDESRYFEVKRILVVRKSDGKVLQTIYPNVDPFEEFYWSGNPVELEDINFDGHLDFSLISHRFMYSSQSAFYLFDPVDTTFSGVALLNEFENVEVLPKLRALHTGSHSGPAFFYHTLFQWQEGKLVKVGEEIWSDMGDTPFHSIAGLGPNGWMEGELHPDRKYPEGNIEYGKDSLPFHVAPYDYISPGRLAQFLK
jgi:hypothetical protein